MSTAARSPGRARRRPSPRARRRSAARRRLAVLLAAVVGAVAALAALLPLDRAVQEITLPLSHEDVIRQQAADKGLDAALIAGVIYAESRFREGLTSPAGAEGLMQITPDTARFIARRSGGSAFTLRDLADPQINIAYGSFYLRYLLDRFHGDTVHALAAYNAGDSNVRHWLARTRGTLRPRDIPFPETREYVRRVLDARAAYRREYPRELGLG
jgi:soluble lytic murein transglycosylase